MKIVENERRVELTRTNLISLLSKLDGSPPGSFCTITKDGWAVKAVEDDVHYRDEQRPRGVMHPDTETALERYSIRSRPAA